MDGRKVENERKTGKEAKSAKRDDYRQKWPHDGAISPTNFGLFVGLSQAFHQISPKSVEIIDLKTCRRDG